MSGTPFEEEDVKLLDPDDLEGNFSTWTNIASLLIPRQVNLPTRITWRVDEIRKYLYLMYEDSVGDNTLWISNLHTLNTVFLSPALADYYRGIGVLVIGDSAVSNASDIAASGSRQRYVVLIRADNLTVEIWKEGVLVWNFDFATINPAASVSGVYLSSSGKYLICYYLIFPATSWIYVFEGS